VPCTPHQANQCFVLLLLLPLLRCSARLLADDVRASVVGYLSVIRGVEGGMAKLGMGMYKHPALERAERLLRSAWRQVRAVACVSCVVCVSCIDC
jgi:hypothetical protein